MNKPAKSLICALLVPSALALVIAGTIEAQTDLGIARYTAAGELIYPDDLDLWVMMGASLGSDYNQEAFDPANPGTIGVVQMEPNAYRYFRANGEYADGTMFLLSFFRSESKSQPQLQGFVQGDRIAQEIHVVDRNRFTEGHGFFLFPAPGTNAGKLPDGSTCIQCHSAEGRYNATFTQFYPAIRDQR